MDQHTMRTYRQLRLRSTVEMHKVNFSRLNFQNQESNNIPHDKTTLPFYNNNGKNNTKN